MKLRLNRNIIMWKILCWRCWSFQLTLPKNEDDRMHITFTIINTQNINVFMFITFYFTITFHSIPWQELNQNDSTKRWVCTDKMIKKTRSVGLHEHNNDEWKMNDEKGMPDEPLEGSWQTKVSLGCVLSGSIHSSPRVRD